MNIDPPPPAQIESFVNPQVKFSALKKKKKNKVQNNVFNTFYIFR